MSKHSARCYNRGSMNRLWIVILMFALVVPMAAQRGTAPAVPTPQGQQPPKPEKDQTISINVDLVDLLVSVADKKGFEDDKIQSITNFSSETDLPLTIALLVDTSGSIRDKLRFEQEAAIEFFYSTLRRGKDKALVISFDSGVDLLQDFTDDPEKLSDAVRKIRAGGGTSLYDAIYLGVNEKLTNQPGRRVLILISDGDDNSSRTSLTETLEVAQKNFVTIYGISTNSAAYFGSKEQDRGDKTLKKFSEETGGKPFFPFKVQDLAISFQDISEELRSQYRIAYRSSNARADGTYRKVRVDVSDKRFPKELAA
ncbi:MAG: VWA domain-containing protein [Acidobacteria bacterium]|nr:MAG: VWA domain-containing protein [Acidobacteriota bacterium]